MQVSYVYEFFERMTGAYNTGSTMRTPARPNPDHSWDHITGNQFLFRVFSRSYYTLLIRWRRLSVCLSVCLWHCVL